MRRLAIPALIGLAAVACSDSYLADKYAADKVLQQDKERTIEVRAWTPSGDGPCGPVRYYYDEDGDGTVEQLIETVECAVTALSINRSLVRAGERPVINVADTRKMTPCEQVEIDAEYRLLQQIMKE